MFWVQGGTAFLLWIAYGVYQARRAQKVRQWALSVSPTKRGLTSAGLFLGSLPVLFGGLALVNALGGFGRDRMTAWAWILITLVGFAFVHLQTLGMALLVVAAQNNNVTPDSAEASDTKSQSL